MKKYLYIITIVLLLIVFGVSAFHVVTYVAGSRQQAAKYDDMAAQLDAQDAAAATTPTPSVPVQDPTDSTTAPEEIVPVEDPTDPETGILTRYLEFYEQNPDMVGWIKLEGTKLNYPVMQTPNNKDYYLDHNFDREHSDWGAIYAREECDVFRPSDNVTLYGHTMKDGSMFACLHEYTEKEAWENNNVIFYDTLYERHLYQIFAVFATTASLGEGFSYHQVEDVEDEAEFNEFIATCKDLAFYETGITPVYGDKIICLSTCEYTEYAEHGRLVVAAFRIS